MLIFHIVRYASVSFHMLITILYYGALDSTPRPLCPPHTGELFSYLLRANELKLEPNGATSVC